MLPGSGAVLVRVAAVVPVILLVLFAALLGLLGLLCGRERRRYVANLSRQALDTASVLMHGPATMGQAADSPRQLKGQARTEPGPDHPGRRSSASRRSQTGP